LKTTLRILLQLVKGKRVPNPAALEAMIPIPVIRLKMAERTQQEDAEAAPFTNDGAQVVLGDEHLEEIVQKILRIRRSHYDAPMRRGKPAAITDTDGSGTVHSLNNPGNHIVIAGM
jgi:hypothetical protein